MIDLKIIKLAKKYSKLWIKKIGTHYASCKNKICGDKIKVEINSNGSKIKTMRYETEFMCFLSSIC